MPTVRPLSNHVLNLVSHVGSVGNQGNARGLRNGEQLPAARGTDGRIKVKLPWERGVLPDASAAHQHAAPIVRGWNPKDKEPILGSAQPDAARLRINVSA